MAWLRGRRAVTTNGRDWYMTSKSTAAIWAWVGTGMSLLRSQTASGSHPDPGADMCALIEHVVLSKGLLVTAVTGIALQYSRTATSKCQVRRISMTSYSRA